MKKPLALFALAALAAVVVIIFWMRGNLDGLVRTAIVSYGSAMTQTTVAVDAVNITPTNGRGVISGLIVGNPAGFKTPHLMKVGKIEIEIDIASMTKDVVIIRRIAVVAPDIIYEKGDALTNIDALQKNIGTYLGPSNTTKPGAKLIVDELTIRNARAQASAAFMNGKTIEVALPDITMKDIGRAKGGITAGELGQEITNAIKARLTGAVSFDRLMKSTGEALGKAGAAVKDLFK
jgi:hypothetical protein